MRQLICRRLQVDEDWKFVHKKKRWITSEDDRNRVGDMWAFVALDPDTKLVPSYRVGKRTRKDAVAFMTDLSERFSNRVQLSSNTLNTYVDAVERAFGPDVYYGQLVKFYETEPNPHGDSPGTINTPRRSSSNKPAGPKLDPRA